MKRCPCSAVLHSTTLSVQTKRRKRRKTTRTGTSHLSHNYQADMSPYRQFTQLEQKLWQVWTGWTSFKNCWLCPFSSFSCMDVRSIDCVATPCILQNVLMHAQSTSSSWWRTRKSGDLWVSCLHITDLLKRQEHGALMETGNSKRLSQPGLMFLHSNPEGIYTLMQSWLANRY